MGLMDIQKYLKSAKDRSYLCTVLPRVTTRESHFPGKQKVLKYGNALDLGDEI